MLKPTLHPIERNSPRYRELAYRAVKEAILSGEFAVAQPLVEEQLGQELAISRTPVREALAILEHEQLIGPRGGRGLFVRPVRREEFIESFTALEIVWPDLARRAASRISEDQVFILEELLNRARYDASNRDVRQFLRASLEFHTRLGEAAENQPLADFVRRNAERVTLFWMSLGDAIPVEFMLPLIEQYRAILAAITRREAEEAVRLVIFSVQSVRGQFRELFQGDEQPEWREDLDKLG